MPGAEAAGRAGVEPPATAARGTPSGEAEAEAERARIAAQAEAAARFAMLEAEARGQYEILAKKGEGLKAIVQACGGSEEAFRLLMLEHLDKLAETAATAISNIKLDKVVVWDSGNGQATGNFIQNFVRGMPPMMEVVQDIGGVKLPEFLGRLMPDAAGDGAAAASSDDEVARALASDAAPPSADDRARSVPATGGERRATIEVVAE